MSELRAATLRAATISDVAGTGPAALTGQWAMKAVGSWDGTVPAYTKTLNLTSLTDNGIGNWTHNFTNLWADDEYTYAGGCNFLNTTAAGLVTQASNSIKTTAALQLYTTNSDSISYGDYTVNGFHSAGDLA